MELDPCRYCEEHKRTCCPHLGCDCLKKEDRLDQHTYDYGHDMIPPDPRIPPDPEERWKDEGGSLL